jgi:tRNA pseudouridine38-40 synthase
MRNLKLKIEYDGTNYCGWQVQKSHQLKSIQEVIEKTLQRILQEKIKLIASGRTDAGVHALGQVANFRTNSKIALEKLQRALNGLLPPDIAIKNIEEVPLDFHSRFAAKSKTYRYSILNQPYPSVFLRKRAYLCPFALDINLMRGESRSLVGRHDFKAFCASRSTAISTVRSIKKIGIKRLSCAPLPAKDRDCRLIVIDIEADGFLYNMVRSIVGTLVDIGRSRFKRGSLKKILLSKDRKHSGTTAPSCGLCLMEVKY